MTESDSNLIAIVAGGIIGLLIVCMTTYIIYSCCCRKNEKVSPSTDSVKARHISIPVGEEKMISPV